MSPRAHVYDVLPRFMLCEGVDPMGRGRAKAKQTKVARELKYRTHDPDLAALQRELSGRANGRNGDVHAEQDDPDELEDGADEDDRFARRR